MRTMQHAQTRHTTYAATGYLATKTEAAKMGNTGNTGDTGDTGNARQPLENQ